MDERNFLDSKLEERRTEEETRGGNAWFRGSRMEMGWEGRRSEREKRKKETICTGRANDFVRRRFRKHGDVAFTRGGGRGTASSTRAARRLIAKSGGWQDRGTCHAIRE